MGCVRESTIAGTMHCAVTEACKINMHPNLVVGASHPYFKAWRPFNAPLRRVTLSLPDMETRDDEAHA